MKTLTAAFIFLFSIPAFAVTNGEGVYAYAHEVGFGGGYNAKSCLIEKGRWEKGVCYFATSDVVNVEKNLEEWNVKVSTIRNNGRDCEFVGKAKAVSDTELLASMESGEPLLVEPAGAPIFCELKITYLNQDTIKVEKLDARNCEYVCGSYSGLDIPQASRVR